MTSPKVEQIREALELLNKAEQLRRSSAAEAEKLEQKARQVLERLLSDGLEDAPPQD